jgi:hypothetical protein
MNPLLSRTILMFAFGLPLVADGASPSVNLDVKLEGKADYKGSSTKTQSRTLNIKIENYGKDAVPDVKVKWWVFGHNMKDHGFIILKQGESKVAMPSKAKTEVASTEVDATGTREHKVTSRKGGGKRGRASTKTIPASGQEYYGYAVEVYSGNTQIAAEYSKPSIKENLHPLKD